MLIRMKQARMGSEDGFGVKRFEAGKVYEVADSLAAYFIRWKQAEVQPIIDDVTNAAWYNIFWNGGAGAAEGEGV